MKLIQSFARPGGNITGVTELHIELAPKRLEVLYELISGLKRVLFLYDARLANAVAWVQAYRDAARRLGIMLVEKPLQTAEEARIILSQVQKGAVDGILQPPSVALNIPGFILKTAAKEHTPQRARWR